MNPPDPIARLNAALEGRYRVESELGEGGMARVYLADVHSEADRDMVPVLPTHVAHRIFIYPALA